MERARNRTLSGYSEKHHVIPRCLGGSNHPDNLVRLTGSEHFLAHLLLVKMYPTHSGLAYAAHMMTVSSLEHGPGRLSNKRYDWLRRKISSEAKKRTGEKNGSFGTRWITDGQINRKIAKSDPIPDGWSAGMTAPRKTPLPPDKICPSCSKEFKSHKGIFCSHKCSRKQLGVRTKKIDEQLALDLISKGLNNRRILIELGMSPMGNNYTTINRLRSMPRSTSGEVTNLSN